MVDSPFAIEIASVLALSAAQLPFIVRDTSQHAAKRAYALQIYSVQKHN